MDVDPAPQKKSAAGSALSLPQSHLDPNDHNGLFKLAVQQNTDFTLTA